MRLKLTFITITASLLLNINSLKAQTDTSTITPSHLLAAKELILTARGTDARFLMMRKNTIETVSASVPEKNRQKFEVNMNAFMDKYLPFDGFIDFTARIYADLFTEAELKQLISFYNSPIGKKVTSVLPQILQKTMLLDHNLLVEHGDELQAIVNESIKE